MARFRYQHIKSSVEGKAPTAAQLKVAEIGVNDFAGDEKLFIKNSESDVVDFPRGYSRAYIDEIERVAAESLNDLDSRKLDASAYTPTDLSNYYTKGETSGASEISTALNGKLDASAYTPTDLTNYYTKSETSGATEIQDALDDKQNVLVSGTNIKTINNESILGEGNITISGGSGTVDQVLDETTSASTNAIATQAVYGPIADLSGQSETVATALVELNSEHETIAAALVDLNSEHETIAYSLVDLNNRILEISGNTPSINIDQVIDSTTSASTGAVSTSAVYGFVTSYTPSITVDQVLDNTKSASTNPVSSKAVYEVIVENEEIVSAALTELNDNKLDASAYTPTDLSNYYTKSETSGATEIQNALDEKADLSDIPSVNGYADSVKYNSTSHYVEFYHGTTAGTKVFEYDASPFLIDGMVESVAITTVTSGGSEVQVLEITWNSAAGSQVTDIPLSDIFDPTNYYQKSETSGATEISTALAGKSDTGHTHDDRYYTETEVDTALAGKSDTGHTHDDRYYTKTEVDIALAEKADTATTLSGYGITDAYTKSEINDAELVISNALNDLEEKKLDASAYTPTDLSNYYTKDETSGATEISNALDGKLNTSDFNTYSGAVDTVIASKASESDLNTLSGTVTAHTADTTIHHTSTSAVTSGSTDVIESGGVYEQLDGIKLKKITQSAYDALVQAGTVDPNTLYIITD